MKDLFQVFGESLQTISDLIDQQNFSGCSSIATDLITISVMSDFKDGILIGEVFEGVFDQIAPLFQQFEINDKDQSVIREQVKQYVGLVARSYKSEDKRELYEALKNLRTIATEFQFKCYKTMKPKPGLERTPGFYAGRRE